MFQAPAFEPEKIIAFRVVDDTCAERAKKAGGGIIVGGQLRTYVRKT